ncbi:hypothetical protein C8A01DRAFT_48216 [Parachaetomium inaequale]|uniref:Uncharacterized protein n=1 Tax=Parachaetomium inaequale TaxID=2588326 RepID=A0AAN6PFS6_9PEZI|nr:hypothetical protein C8A01DRAFT_48216 [Parachaetomium inaequale]
MTDEELDREWKPNGRRPQSTVAQMFSQELMDIFRIDNSVADLDEKVDKRKQQITSQTTELEALEARIREMEMRLKGQAPNSGPSTSASTKANDPNAPPPPPAKDHPADQNRAREQQQQKYAGSRPGTARQGQPAVPGALPPTPAGSEGEFEPSVVCPSRVAVAPRPPGTQAQSRTGAPKPGAGVYPSARANELPVPGGDADSVKSLSDSASFADYVIVPEPDGDRERDA